VEGLVQIWSEPMAAFIHPTAVVDAGAVLGEDTKVWHFCHVCAGARIGRGCALGQNVYVAPTAVLGDGVRVQNNVSLYDGVVLEDHVFVGPSAVFTNVVRPRVEHPRKDAYATTRVGRGATIGANATIVCGTTLGAYAFIGAGAVVTRDVPAHALVMGNPARQRGWACCCGERLPAGATPRCASCGRGYALSDDGIVEV
jgi:UDP-2-acetamido-3-amino-2,3-dideoxy-glucuronate N-acetyltransferase